jgi:hypothetical protein
LSVAFNREVFPLDEPDGHSLQMSAL